MVFKKEFVGRKEEIQKFWNIYNNIESNCKVINFFGMTGMGKTMLLNKLEQELEAKMPKSYHIKIDIDFCFNKDLETSHFSQAEEEILLKMRNQLIDKYKFKFKLFDKTLYQYYESIGIHKERPEMQMILSRNENVSQAVEVIKDLLGNNGIFITALKTVDLGVSFIKKLIDNDKDTLSSEILYENLAKCFALDLQNNLAKKQIIENNPLVIFIDTFEMLIKGNIGAGNQLISDIWLRNDIVKSLDNVLWVIAGREKIKWNDNDEKEIGIEKCELHNLSIKDSLEFLRKAGIVDETLRNNIYKKSEGMPMYLNLCVEQYNTLKEKNKPIDISCFGNNLEKLSNNIIRNLSIEDQEILSYLSCMNNWSDEFIRNLGSKFITCFSYIRYNNLKNRSFVEKSSNGQYAILKIAKNLLNKNCDVNIKSIAKENLSTYYERQVQDENLNIEDKIDLLYKYVENNIEQEQSEDIAITKFSNIEEHLNMLDRLRKHEDLKNLLVILWNRFKLNKNLIGKISRMLINTLIKLSEYKKAEQFVLEYEKIYCKEPIESEYYFEYVNSQDLKGEVFLYRNKYEEAYTIFKNAYKERPNDLYIQEKLALTYGRKNQHKKEIELLEDVLLKEEIRKEVFGDLKIRTTKRNIANAFSHCGEYQKAIDIYDQLINTAHDELEKASLKNNKSNSLSLLGKYEEAYKTVREAYQTRKEILGEKHLITINTLYNMANILANLHKFKDAIDMYEIAYIERKEKLGEQNDDTLRTLSSKAITYFYAGEINEALRILQEVYKITSSKYKQDDLRVVTVLNNLAKVYNAKGESEKALSIAEKVYDVRLNTLGHLNADTLTTASLLGNIYLKLGRKEEGRQILEDTLKKAKKVGYDSGQSFIVETNDLLKAI